MPSHKKIDKENKAIKKAQNRRFLDCKKVQGLKAITVFVPIDALEKCKDLKRIAVVLGGDDLNPLAVMARCRLALFLPSRRSLRGKKRGMAKTWSQGEHFHKKFFLRCLGSKKIFVPLTRYGSHAHLATKEATRAGVGQAVPYKPFFFCSEGAELSSFSLGSGFGFVKLSRASLNVPIISVCAVVLLVRLAI